MLVFREETNCYLSSVCWSFSSCIWVLLSRLRMGTVSWLGVSLAEAAVPHSQPMPRREAVGKPSRCYLPCSNAAEARSSGSLQVWHSLSG